MEIIKSKRKSKCSDCFKQIELKYKVIDDWENHLHLSCYQKNLLIRLENLKEEKKELGKKKYKKVILLENL